MANFMYLFWNKGGDPPRWGTAEMQEQMRKWTSWTASLAGSGHLKGGESLENDGKVIRGPKRITTAGPYAEAGDTVAGYLIISAKDLDEAVELSKNCPVLEGGWMVEVRPVQRTSFST